MSDADRADTVDWIKVLEPDELPAGRAADLDEALARAIEHPGPALVEILTDPELV